MIVRQAVHRLATSPGFFVLSVLTLAVGIAATTAIMSVVDAILIRPLPYPESARLVVPMHDAPGLDFVGFGHAEGTYRLYREHNQVFDDFAIYSEWATTLTGEGHPERLEALVVTPSIFPVLGLAPALGRAFREDDGLPGAPPVVIVGDALWRRRFGADPGVIGRSLVLDGVSTEIVGVLPPGAAFPRRGFDAWLAMRIDPAGTTLGIFGNDAVARLAEGVTVEAAEADLNRLASNLEAAFPGQRAASVLARAGVAVRTPRLRDEVVGEVASALRILLATMAVVLTIACVNVANLFLVRTERRRHETAVRVAVGATRGALVRSAFAESATVAVVAGLVGLAGAWAAVRLVVLLAPENKIPRLHEVGIDGRVLAFTAIVALAATVVFGLIPAFAWRVRRLLVVVQVALALVLAIAAGLMVRSLDNLSQVDPGFDPEGVMIARVALARPEYPDDAAAAAFYDRLLEKLAALPGVEAAGGISALPIAGSFYLQAHALRDFPIAEDGVAPVFERAIITPGYLEAMKIPLVEGRFPDRADHQHRTGALVLSETLARRWWGAAGAVGKHLAPGRAPDDDGGWYTIVGVVGDVRSESLVDEPREIVYYPMLAKRPGAWWPANFTLAVRVARGAPEAIVGPVREAVRGLDPNLPIFSLRTLEDVVREARAPMAFTVVLLLVAAAVALLLGGVGTFGVVSYLAGRRTAEIGIRMALGARRRDVLGLVLRQGLVLGGAGAAVGLVGAVLLTRWLESILFEVDPVDALTFIAVPVVLLAVTLVASLVPARRASRIDPIMALRYE